MTGASAQPILAVVLVGLLLGMFPRVLNRELDVLCSDPVTPSVARSCESFALLSGPAIEPEKKANTVRLSVTRV